MVAVLRDAILDAILIVDAILSAILSLSPTHTFKEIGLSGQHRCCPVIRE
jgi:hypothetical protein